MRRHGQGVGRPRESRIDQALAAATRALLAEIGYANLTVDAIAARAGVGKAAIYRRHATKQELVFAAAIHDLDLQRPPDTGALRTDLAGLIGDIINTLSNPVAAAAVPGLLADITADPAMTARFQQSFIALERKYLVEVLNRAAARGELPNPPDPDLVHALLLGAVFARLFLLGHDVDNLADQLAGLVTAALTASPDGSSSGHSPSRTLICGSLL